MITGISVIDEIAAGPFPSSGGLQSETERGLLGGEDLETIVLRLVKDDPFASISEIKRTVCDSTPFDDVGWLRIFGLLRRHRLLTRRARFRFSRGRR